MNILSKFKKPILITLILVTLFPILAQPAQAFSTPTLRGGYYFNFENAVFKVEEMNLQSFVNETMKATAGSIFSSVVGCLTCTPEERELYPGLISTVSYFIASIYSSPPASGVQYLADLGRQLEIVQPAYAQGYGFELMDPLQAMWRAFRNFSYVFFVLILVFMGFAIMFRIKISPQAVISIQSAFPRIILGLVLITFSYAVVGLVIDLMMVVMALISNAFIGDGGIVEQGIPGLGSVISAISGIGQIASSTVAGTAIAAGIFFALATLIALIVGILLGPINWLILIIAVVLILIAIIRCLWAILKAYAMIIISLIFGPLQIMIGVLPGSNAIGSWFRNLLANAAVLPTIMTMFYIASYLILSGITGLFSDPIGLILAVLSGWTGVGQVLTAFMAVIDPAHFVQFVTTLILPIVGIAILLMAPKAADMIKAFMTQQPFEYGTAIGYGLGPAGAVVGTPLGYGKYEAGKRLEQYGAAGKTGPDWMRSLATGVAGYLRDKGWYK